MSAAPGFHFSCTRCGNCCRVGHGRVWLEAGEIAAMAELLEVSEAAFVAEKVVQVEGRLSLRERSDGRCILLESQSECTVYAARPRQCREFPNWPQLEEAEALKAAAAYCPGIQLFPDAHTAARTLPRVAAVIAEAGGVSEVDVPRRWASSLEVDVFLATGEVIIPADPESALRALQGLAEEEGYPWAYGSWPRLLADRNAGWLARGGLPTS